MKSLNELAKEIQRINESKGFTCPKTIKEHTHTLGKLMLVVSEIGEAAEAVRIGDFENFKEEIADTIIRLLHITSVMNINIDKEIRKKLRINKQRKVLHGKIC